ncbi:IS66 family insertion sequence element accessory protein TnpB [Burkholderia ubonensis]|uniref:IS66 family insertion sequence element accessory protein TnpB n=1 Tax=Burkholderia ubonensis TaxID=101571 RepID=UPI0008FDACBF|nr:IS66 family insertion sequence element accessory protein TnpB [Burkholderia ubonensis]
MFRFDEGLRVFVHREPVDFRMGINGLSILVEQAMSLNPMAQALYVFGNRRRDRIKILAWDGNGFWLLLKRMRSMKDAGLSSGVRGETQRSSVGMAQGSSAA